MSNTHHRPSRRRRTKLGVLGLLLIPLLLLLHAPVLAAVVPGALITMASLDALQRGPVALPAAQVLTDHDVADLQRMAAATPIPAVHHRIDR